MKPVPDLPAIRHVMIVKPSSLGDVIHALPAVAALKSRWPHLSLDWVINTEWAPILNGCPLLSRVTVFPRNQFRGLSGSARAAAWFAALRHRRPDLALDFQGLLRSALIARASRARIVIGLSDAREGARHLHTHTVRVEPRQHAVDRNFALVRTLDVTGSPPGVESVLTGGEPVAREIPDQFVLVHPYARGAGKALSAGQLETLVQAIAPMPVVIAGRAALRDDQSRASHVVDLTNRTTLPELIWLMRRASAVVSVDSGPMHLAAALARPLIGIHTWSDPRTVGPYSERAIIWKGGRLVPRAAIDDQLAARRDLTGPDDLAEIARCAVEMAHRSDPRAP